MEVRSIEEVFSHYCGAKKIRSRVDNLFPTRLQPCLLDYNISLGLVVIIMFVDV